MEGRRGKLGLRGRHELRLIEEGASLRAAARALGVAPATAHRWWHRWQAASEHERGTLACLASHPPIPRLVSLAVGRGDRAQDPRRA